MTAPSYRLDTICGNLIERLEGSRRTWIGDEPAARDGIKRIVTETLDRIVEEHDDLLGPSGWGEALRTEVTDTFVPRYMRMAMDQNALEAQGYKAWRKGDPIARFAATFATLLLAVATVRLVHHPVALLSFGGVLLALLMPEIRSWYYRRRYRGLLQEVVDDMGRIQEELERYPANGEGNHLARLAATEPETTRRPDGTKEPIG